MCEWSEWRSFPDPAQLGYLVAPLGPGVYELRNRLTFQLVLVGIGTWCAYRMSSLLPDGAGTRNNNSKREYVAAHVADIEYRTIACRAKSDAARIERELKRRCSYLFPT